MSLEKTLVLASKLPPVAGARVAASVYYGNYLVATGKNSRKTHPLMAKFGKNDKAICLHAEVDAIKNCLHRFPNMSFDGCTMYVARAKADGSPGLAKPCEGCARALISFGIAECYWTENEIS